MASWEQYSIGRKINKIKTYLKKIDRALQEIFDEANPFHENFSLKRKVLSKETSLKKKNIRKKVANKNKRKR